MRRPLGEQADYRVTSNLRRSLRAKLALLLLAPIVLTPTGPADGAECKLAKLIELPVTMDGRRPTVPTKINGADALFTLDSGAFWSLLSPASAAQYKLRLDSKSYPGLSIGGVGGSAAVSIATVAQFTIFGIPLNHVDFLVGGGEPGQGTVGIIGQNLLRFADVEYDLAHGVIRFFKPDGCRKADLAYWVGNGEPYSLMDIEWATAQSPHTIGAAYLDGVKIRVIFDSGAANSLVGLRAAERAGVKPGGAGVAPSGESLGVGRRTVQTWVATFQDLKIGDEEVRNARLRFGDIGPHADMLLGVDFFLSHRIYVASSQNKLYFTYNGGPVFNLSAPSSAARGPVPATTPSAASSVVEDSATSPREPPGDESRTFSSEPADASSASPPPIPTGEPTDAAGFARRGAAFAARNDFEHALHDFARACELAPNEADYFYQRGLARLGNKQPQLALSDFDQALTLKPDHVPALVSRGALRLANHDVSAAATDLDAADRAAPKEADIRLRLATLYVGADRLPQAIAQYDLWIAVHADDARIARAYNGRCRTRAFWGQQLDRALRDCNAALRTYPQIASFLDSRGLVYVRTGKLDKAIADYDAALHINPRAAWSLYGRGVAKLHKGMTAAGQADIAAAAAINPHLAERAQRFGIGP